MKCSFVGETPLIPASVPDRRQMSIFHLLALWGEICAVLRCKYA